MTPMKTPQFFKKLKFKHDLRRLGEQHRKLYGVSFEEQFREAWHLHQLNDLEAYEYVDNHFSAPDLTLEEKERFASYNQLCWIQRELNPRGERGSLNKWVLFHVLSAARLPTPYIYGFFDPDFGYTPERHSFRTAADIGRILDQNNLTDFVIKPANGEKGFDVWVFSGRDGADYLTLAGERMSVEQIHALMLKLFDAGRPHRRDGVLLQQRIEQHDTLAAINPHCTNTLRVITLINSDFEIEVLASQLKFGRGRSMVDNTSQGAVSSFVGSDGAIGPLIYVDSEQMTRYDRHPDTGVQVVGTKLPFFNEAYQLAIEAQRCYPQLRTIGWDIAITNAGPVVIEGNVWYGWQPQVRGRRGFISPGLRKILDDEIMPKYRG